MYRLQTSVIGEDKAAGWGGDISAPLNLYWQNFICVSLQKQLTCYSWHVTADTANMCRHPLDLSLPCLWAQIRLSGTKEEQSSIMTMFCFILFAFNHKSSFWTMTTCRGRPEVIRQAWVLSCCENKKLGVKKPQKLHQSKCAVISVWKNKLCTVWVSEPTRHEH